MRTLLVPLFVLATSLLQSAAATETIVLRSGNGATSAQDSLITVAEYPADVVVPAFQTADFEAAASGAPAWVIPPSTVGGWLPVLGADPTANWVSSNLDRHLSPSGLYAIPFQVDADCITSASLDIAFAVDNELGQGSNTGLFINGLPIPGTAAAPGVNVEAAFQSLDISEMVNIGGNFLYLYVFNFGGPGGVVFSATITLNEVGSWTDLGGGTSGIHGVPTLVAGGELTGLSATTLDLANCPFNGIVLGWVSFTSVPQSYFGGTIHATPFNLQYFFLTTGQGELHLATHWPSGVAPCTSIWIQFLVRDLSVPPAITLSNAVRATTP